MPPWFIVSVLSFMLVVFLLSAALVAFHPDKEVKGVGVFGCIAAVFLASSFVFLLMLGQAGGRGVFQ
jgi:hypothetical protein